MPRISIDGSIGVGKTTVLKRLGEELGLDVFLEPVEDWSPCLQRFYTDTERWGLCLNAKVLCSFAKVPKDGVVLCERSPLSCRRVFTEVGTKDPIELDVLNDLYAAVGWVPKLIIYIRSSPESCMQRIKKRGRKEESNISIDYLIDIHQKYEQLYKTDGLPVVVVDGEGDVETVYQRVKAQATQLLVSK